MITGCTNSTATWRACSGQSGARHHIVAPAANAAGQRIDARSAGRGPSRPSVPSGTAPSSASRPAVRTTGHRGSLPRHGSRRSSSDDATTRDARDARRRRERRDVRIDAADRIVLWNHAAERLCRLRRPTTCSVTALPRAVPERPRASTPRRSCDAVLAGDRVDRWETRSSGATGCPCRSRCRCARSSTPTARTCGAVAIAVRHHRATARAGRCWPRPRRGCRRARPWRTSAAGCGTWPPAPCSGATEFHRIHGVDPLEFEGTIDAHLGRIVHEDDRRCGDALERAVATGRAVDVDYRILRPDGGSAGSFDPGRTHDRRVRRRGRAARHRPRHHRRLSHHVSRGRRAAARARRDRGSGAARAPESSDVGQLAQRVAGVGAQRAATKSSNSSDSSSARTDLMSWSKSRLPARAPIR